MSNAMTKADQAGLPALREEAAAQEVLKGDVLIPKLLLMQGLSEFVNERKAAQGDMVRSLTGEVVGNPDKPVEFIPVMYTNTWVEEELVGKKYEFRQEVPRNARNEADPWEFTHNGAPWRRKKSINLYAILTKDIAAEAEEIRKFKETGELPDADKALLPVLISFRSTSFKAGMKLATHFQKAKKFGVPGYVNTFKLKCYQDKNDQGTYYVLDVESAGKTAPEALKLAQEWNQILSTGSVKVHEVDAASKGDANEDDIPF